MDTQRVAVTGGSGKAGVAVVDDLRRQGFEVVNMDIAASPDPDQPSVIVDLSDLGQTLDALSGFDMVVHLAAIPAPNILTDGETFRINSVSTYNIFVAAMGHNMKRVVWASSETLIGLPFVREAPRYAPIDEEHPLLPESHYALSKLVGEAMADQFSRWSGIPITALRISNIMTEDDYQRFPSFWDDPRIRAWNLWGYVDARDVALAVRLALMSNRTATDAYLVAASDTCMTRESRDLLEDVYPEVGLARAVSGHETLLAIDKARDHLGYEPGHTWRDYVRP